MKTPLRQRIFVIGLSLIAAALLVGFKSFSAAADKEQAAGKWDRLKIVTYSSGLTGFFDPDSGKLYVYDSNVEKCFIERQLVKLGEPLEKLKN